MNVCGRRRERESISIWTQNYSNGNNLEISISLRLPIWLLFGRSQHLLPPTIDRAKPPPFSLPSPFDSHSAPSSHSLTRSHWTSSLNYASICACSKSLWNSPFVENCKFSYNYSQAMQFGCIQRLDFTVFHFIPIDMHIFLANRLLLSPSSFVCRMRKRACASIVNNNKNQLDASILFYLFHLLSNRKKQSVLKHQATRLAFMLFNRRRRFFNGNKISLHAISMNCESNNHDL